MKLKDCGIRIVHNDTLIEHEEIILWEDIIEFKLTNYFDYSDIIRQQRTCPEKVVAEIKYLKGTEVIHARRKFDEIELIPSLPKLPKGAMIGAMMGSVVSKEAKMITTPIEVMKEAFKQAIEGMEEPKVDVKIMIDGKFLTRFINKEETLEDKVKRLEEENEELREQLESAYEE